MDVLAVGDATEVGEAAARLQQAGVEVHAVEDPLEAAGRIAGGAVTTVLVGPGAEAVATLGRLPGAVRRRLVVVQVENGVPTGDGNAAFLRGVSLLVATGDLARLPDLLARTERRHRELAALLEPELAP